MAFNLGPILYFREMDAAHMHVRALVVRARERLPGTLATELGECQAQPLATRCDSTVWAYDFALPRDRQSRCGAYSIDNRGWHVTVPGRNADLRCAFTACNGNDTDDSRNLDTGERNERWRCLYRVHQERPFHLLLQGGDQLYADELWQMVPALAQWQRLPYWQRLRYEPQAEEVEAVRDFYFARYCRLWGQRDLAPALATIPSLMMWDDHDIFDGWGSHAPAWQHSPMVQAIGRAAREHFALFQLGGYPEQHIGDAVHSPPAHFAWARRLDAVGIVAPDLRSQRTRRRVMGDDQRAWLSACLADMRDCRRVLLLSSVPLANVRLSALERVLVSLPGQQRYQDDLRDQWQSYAHRREWLSVIDELIDFVHRHGVELTVLSGEIHVAAYGMLARGEARIHQLVSSGIAHDPPPDWLARAYHLMGAWQRRVGRGIRCEMRRLPELGRRYLNRRNWLELTCRPDGALVARWHAQGMEAELSLTL